jgi:DNA-binding GntR family transcriptional regulator
VASRAGSDYAIALDHSSPIPLYHQLARELERAIADGRIERGGFLENEVELADVLQLSRPTVRRSIQQLVDQGLLVRQRGVGTRVVNDTIRPSARVSSLFDELQMSGRSPSTVVLAMELLPGDARITDVLGLERGASILYIERCRIRNWLVPAFSTGLTIERLEYGGLYAHLRSKGCFPHFATRKIGAHNASPVDSALLGLAVGQALLTVTTCMQDRHGNKVDFAEMVCDASEYSLELTVVES